MPTRYFAASVDQNWDTLGNWWSDAACTEGFSGTLTGVNVTDTDTEVTCDSTAGLVVGRPITGDGIDTGTTVASITDGTTFELSQAAISTETSNLTCELHVVPVTADDVVIATGNGTVAGTPSADVLALVQVNGDSVLNVTLEAANFEFNNTSSNSGTITGNCTLNSSTWVNTGTIFGDCVFNNGYNHSSGTITGVCEFNSNSYNQGTINGNCTFYGSSNNGSVTGDCEFNDGSGNYGSITGNCEFNDTGSNGNNGSITGNCTFNDSSTNEDTIVGAEDDAVEVVFNDTCHNNATGDITGNCTFYDSSHNDGLVTGDCVFNDTSLNDYNTPGHVSGNATFNDSSYNQGTITGNATFTEAEYSYALTTVINPQLGTVSGTVTFSSLTPVKFTLVNTASWAGDTTGWVFDTAGQSWEFNDSSYNQGTITGNATVRQHAAAFVAWRDYATSTYVTGTLTLQFPEMDILGTGLL
jgi:hypothetical protein